jgi:hypothetical protein
VLPSIELVSTHRFSADAVSRLIVADRLSVWLFRIVGVCIENLVRIDLLTESPHVGDDGRADMSLLEPGRVAL